MLGIEILIPYAVILAFIAIYDRFRTSQLDAKFSVLKRDLCENMNHRLDDIMGMIRDVSRKSDENQDLLIQYKSKNELRRGTDELKQEALKYADDDIKHIVAIYGELIYNLLITCYLDGGKELTSELVKTELGILNKRVAKELEELPLDFFMNHLCEDAKIIESIFMKDVDAMVNGPLNAVRISFVSLGIKFYREMLELLVKRWTFYNKK